MVPKCKNSTPQPSWGSRPSLSETSCSGYNKTLHTGTRTAQHIFTPYQTFKNSSVTTTIFTYHLFREKFVADCHHVTRNSPLRLHSKGHWGKIWRWDLPEFFRIFFRPWVWHRLSLSPGSLKNEPRLVGSVDLATFQFRMSWYVFLPFLNKEEVWKSQRKHGFQGVCTYPF